jgi:hypothetical protein
MYAYCTIEPDDTGNIEFIAADIGKTEKFCRYISAAGGRGLLSLGSGFRPWHSSVTNYAVNLLQLSV